MAEDTSRPLTQGGSLLQIEEAVVPTVRESHPLPTGDATQPPTGDAAHPPTGEPTQPATDDAWHPANLLRGRGVGRSRGATRGRGRGDQSSGAETRGPGYLPTHVGRGRVSSGGRGHWGSQITPSAKQDGPSRYDYGPSVRKKGWEKELRDAELDARIRMQNRTLQEPPATEQPTIPQVLEVIKRFEGMSVRTITSKVAGMPPFSTHLDRFYKGGRHQSSKVMKWKKQKALMKGKETEDVEMEDPDA